MATLVLSAAGAALGGSFGGSLAGISSLALGKAAGAILGNSIDQTILGQGSATVETGHVEQFRVMGASEGTALPRAFGRVRLAGQLIWSSRFLEAVNEEDVGGKGGGGTVREYSYSISLALAICEGEILRVGRIWADGQVLDQSDLNMTVYNGSEDQLPDPLIDAIEGIGMAPAYRGVGYVVFENLPLAPFGNRIPQFNFEVFRRPEADEAVAGRHPALDIRGVALMPGTGEYTLATDRVTFTRGKGDQTVLNVHNDRGVPDLKASMEQLEGELPHADAVSLVVSWFGDDLRCDRCALRPAVEQKSEDGDPMAWTVSGRSRGAATLVGRKDGRPVFGGTPADRSVVQAIQYMHAQGKRVMFYPFILMDILEANGLRDPWSGAVDQPAVPWRGRITLSVAPGLSGSPDKTAGAAAEVSAFFGTARPADFSTSGGLPVYTGGDGWSYRRFVLHYAHLCKLAGGIDAFCIGSELRGLTHVRDGADSYPAVRELCALAEDVRAVLGAGTKIGYAADWSEYFGHQPGDRSGDVFYHLDPLWSHDDIDFIGIDNYMPLSDWREGTAHLDAAHGSVYDIDYLKRNIAGGEGFDWYYADQAGREAQQRMPIADTAYGEDWVFRYKDLVNWWSRPHVNRKDGVKAGAATGWIPRSKPIWFTELGCPAVDKGTNQPNVFYDPKSSESALPYFSTGAQDEFIQLRYLQASFEYWGDAANNPVSATYGAPMVDMSNAYVWAWDARPWPDFPSRLETWIDGENYTLGHWLNGRATLCPLAQLVAEICARSSAAPLDLSKLYGSVTGYSIQQVQDARQSLQPLMLTHAFDCFSVAEGVAFASRGGSASAEYEAHELVAVKADPVMVQTRTPAAEAPGRVAFSYVRDDGDYAAGAVSAISASTAEQRTSQTSLPVVLAEGRARGIAARWLAEGEVGRDAIEFSLPPSTLAVVAGDVFAFRNGDVSEIYRIDRVEEMGHRAVSATRVERALYTVPATSSSRKAYRAVRVPTAILVEFLDLPLLTGNEAPHAAHVAVARKPWAGPIAVYTSSADYGYSLNRQLTRCATVGETLDDLPAGACGRWTAASFRVRLAAGTLERGSGEDVLNGANVAAIRYGESGDWEVMQFRDAELDPEIEEPGCYRISHLLRGQAGTDAVIPHIWAAGSTFVLLNSAVKQLEMPSSSVGLDRHFRVGPIGKPYDSPQYQHRVETSGGVGLRPYRPAHLRATARIDGSIRIDWVRRTRLDGDSWLGADVPLSEDREAYHVRIIEGARVLREFNPTATSQIYSAGEWNKDGCPATFTAEVAQVSSRYGPGPYAKFRCTRLAAG
jgi:hypothetical protein